MRQFEYNFEGDDFSEQDEGEFFYEMGAPYSLTGMPFSSFPMGFVEMGGLNHQLLSTALQICERSWFWRFKTLKKKLEMLIKTYTVLHKLTEIDFGESEEDADL